MLTAAFLPSSNLSTLKNACRVVEWLGPVHDDDTCPADCKEDHEYYFVRVSVKEAPDGSDVESKYKRRLDLAVDLQPKFRVSSPEELFGLSRGDLADAWVLLTPKML